MSDLSVIQNALLTVTDAVYHYRGASPQKRYIVWAEEGQGKAQWADEQMIEQSMVGTIDYFTNIENDPNFNAIQQALNNAEIAWSLNSIQFEPDTDLIHYEWEWEIG